MTRQEKIMKARKNPRPELGELVKVAEWCHEKGRLGRVVHHYWHDTSRVKIQYMDSEGLKQRPSEILNSNLELMREKNVME